MIDNDDDLEDIARKRDEAEKDYRGVDDPKNNSREEVNLRKNSMAATKIVPIVKDNKSSSLAKNYIGGNNLNNRPLSNNLVGQQPNLLGKQPAANNQKREAYGEKVEPLVMNRYNSSNGGGGVVKK